MIVAEQKPLEEIMQAVSGAEKVLVLGCGTCVTVCLSGGEKEAEVLASSMRMKGRLDAENGGKQDVTHDVVQRECEWEYLDSAKELIQGADVVVSLACGIGAQAIIERFPEANMTPGLNTRFYGLPVEQGVWQERCGGCGDCVLDFTDGICPIARCSKSLLNGPCGGSHDGLCEVEDTECAWHLIVERLGKKGHMDRLVKVHAPKSWKRDRDGGPGKIVRKDLMLSKSEEAQG